MIATNKELMAAARKGECIEGGFTSVMIDGSSLPFEENIAVTATVVEKARPKGISVEGELGKLAGIADNVSVAERDAMLTDPAQAEELVERTGVDALAIDTDMRIAFAAHIRKALFEKPEEIDPRKVLGPGREAIAAVVREKIELFGSADKAR